MEYAVQFGNDNRLTGISGIPERVNGPAIILSNAGSLGRVGPNRLWVQLARAANECGFPTLRFDQSGFGDTPVSTTELPISQRRLGEYNDAINFITAKSGAKDVVIVGLCSGAIDAHEVSVVDSRVKASVMVDGYADKTRGYYRRRALDYLFSPRRWKSATTVLRNRFVPMTTSSLAEADALSMSFPDRSQIVEQFRELIDRRFRSLVIYTGSWSSLVNSSRQLFEAFPEVDFDGLFDVELWPTVNHTFTIDLHRAEFVSRVLAWCHEVKMNESY